MLLRAGVLLAVYLRWVRPRQLTWGATAAEAVRTMPGDGLVERPTFDATRAVTVRAPAAAIWPWLVQAGTGRAGWYSYDWIDNLGRPSARAIDPALQDLAVGDLVPMTPSGSVGLPVLAMDPPRSMVWGTPGDTTWAWQLDERPDGTTRLVSRMRSRYRWLSPRIVLSMALELGDVVMMRKMLLNLRDRAESTSPMG